MTDKELRREIQKIVVMLSTAERRNTELAEKSVTLLITLCHAYADAEVRKFAKNLKSGKYYLSHYEFLRGSDVTQWIDTELAKRKEKKWRTDRFPWPPVGFFEDYWHNIEAEARESGFVKAKMKMHGKRLREQQIRISEKRRDGQAKRSRHPMD